VNRFILFLLLCFISFARFCSAEQQKGDRICSSTECYQVIEKLGEGLFAEIYVAEDLNGKRFALKFYKENSAFSESLHLVGEREFLRGQQLNHPNIIKSFDYFTPSNDSSNILVLQFVEGKTYSKLDKGILAKEQSIKNAINFCNAIRYALTLDLVNLDIHDRNVMLDDNENIIIIDLASFFTLEEVTNISLAQNELQHWNQEFDIGKFYVMYFEKVADFCTDILLKANFLRDEKINIKIEIKKIVWSHMEDFEEEQMKPIDFYFDKLIETINDRGREAKGNVVKIK